MQDAPISTSSSKITFPIWGKRKFFSLSGIKPNPFNPITKMFYTLPKRSLVSVKVYNMLGKEVVTLLEKEQSFGKYSISWNGQDNFGKQVSSGVYFAEIRASDKRRINKMLLMK